MPYATISDSWTSTDGSTHSLDLLMRNTNGPNQLYSTFSWAPGYDGTHVGGDTVPGPSGSSGVIRLWDSSQVGGRSDYTAGAIVLHQAPSQVIWTDPYRFELSYQGTVPASGSYQQTTDSVRSTSNNDVSTLGNALLDGATAPSVAFISPADHATVRTRQVNITGTAIDPVAVSTLTINGHPAGVASDGTFSLPVTLSPGANTITAVATNTSDSQASASITVFYRPLAPLCIVPRLIGMKLARAKQALRAARCGVGPVHRVAVRGHAGKVLSQGVPAGWQIPLGTRVSLAVATHPRRATRHHGRHQPGQRHGG